MRGANGRRVQVVRARLDDFSPQVEARFLAIVAATCNVSAACAAVGVSPAAVYRYRNRCDDFSSRWHAAIEEGHLRLETGLLERCGTLFAQEEIEPGLEEDLVKGPISVDQAMQLWFHHR